ncbi:MULTISPECIES: phosphotransferase family protein [unclassified Kitasatospora]|uniref:phosphotransferase family protein n=1 Tax=unclassified Kitasatospora TaxID=2633591 RepID=UPI0006714370|nr:aminoglycoside phosphotransferase family protein [Kitasatospora sp. MY 5-36]
MTTDPRHGEPDTHELDTHEVAVRVARERGIELRGLAGEGVDFAVYRAHCATHGEVALRVPRHRVYSAPYGRVEAGDLVRQEHEIAGLLARQGLPTAPALELITMADGLVVSLAGYVRHDGLTVSPKEVGAFLAALHRVEPPSIELAYQEPGDFPSFLTTRLVTRHATLRGFAPDLPELPHPDGMRAVLEAEEGEPRLLHLDVRRQNLLGSGGRLTAVVDWSNALVGPVLMELARVAEYARLADNGIDADGILAGYADSAELPDLYSRAALLHRLDTVVMLALVFHSVAPDPARAADLTARARHLLERLRG